MREYDLHTVIAKAMRIVTVTGASFAATVILITGMVAFFPGIMLVAFPLKVRSPYCSLWLAIKDHSIQRAQDQTADRIARASQVLKTENNLELVDTPMGRFWIPSGKDRLLSGLLAQQDRNIYGDAEWGVHKGDIVLDCGAYVGVYTRKALASGASLVVAIEPTPMSIECLRRNLAADVAAGRVIICPEGVWDHEGILTLFANGNAQSSNSFVTDWKVQRPIGKIPVTTVDRLADKLKLARVDVIKADIKGATARMLLGARGVLARDHPRIALSTEEPPDNPQSIAALLHRLQPKYQMKCGACFVAVNEIYTDVVFYR